MSNTTARVRDPERKGRILDAAAQLIARSGYQGVNLNDIGTAAGIVGSGIYRHFDNKVAILVELFDSVVDRLLLEAEESLGVQNDPRSTLTALVAGQITFATRDRQLGRVYIQEALNLPPADLRRLRWKQRHYVDLWQEVVRAIRPELSGAEVQTIVYAAIGGIHSILHYEPVMQGKQLERYLAELTFQTMGIEPPAGLAEHFPAREIVRVTKDSVA